MINIKALFSNYIKTISGAESKMSKEGRCIFIFKNLILTLEIIYLMIITLFQIFVMILFDYDVESCHILRICIGFNITANINMIITILSMFCLARCTTKTGCKPITNDIEEGRVPRQSNDESFSKTDVGEMACSACCSFCSLFIAILIGIV
jgi:hypothetical protein